MVAARGQAGQQTPGPESPASPLPAGADRRQAILDSAATEFSAKGFAGARIDVIAREARSNKQLIYYYFGNKAGLYEETLRHMIGRSHEYLDVGASQSLADWIRQMYKRANGAARAWQRLWRWEALEKEPADITQVRERSQVWQRASEHVRTAQEDGEIDADFDPQMLMLAINAIISVPQMLPHLTKLITGSGPQQPRFRRRQEQFLDQLLKHLAPPGPAPRAARSRRTPE